ncbi:hypothetical protein BT67DRAFT_475570 [Trichocladium antarcticum]|uniref:CENP-V/GFA domain-containing protein n=1 Tax=Trichocladium antarcticum TaxID=1450529 RepID=A0AAN6ZI22_9PEZI|nr:hypothetical protein BT67DRAFT_475570 [Trichocladium antarcticum]
MSFERPLQGGCQCGRNHYIIQFPKDPPLPRQLAQVLFSPQPSHRASLSTPLPAYLRVPLSCYHSTTRPLFPDETAAQIRRAWTSPAETHAMRHFCGFCGTPLSYWSEQPRAEAEYIQLALGSLAARDLADLEELGFLEGLGSGEGEAEGEGEGGVLVVDTTAGGGDDGGGDSFGTVGGLPWLDSLTAGSRLGQLRTAKGRGSNRAGTVRVEWEVVEWSEEEDGGGSPRKRKLEEAEERTEAGTA